MTRTTRPLVYVAGPITGDPWGCVAKATEVYYELKGMEIQAYLPQLSVLHEMIAPQPHHLWMVDGLDMIERCDGLVRLSGESPGADEEVAHAEMLGLPVFHWFGAMGDYVLWKMAVREFHARNGLRWCRPRIIQGVAQ